MSSTPANQRAAIRTAVTMLEERAADLGFDVEVANDGVILNDGERIEFFANPSDAFSFLSRLRRQS